MPSETLNSTYYIKPVEPGSFSTRRFGAIHHNLHEHPLMQMDALEQLAHRLMPLEKCRFIKPGTEADSEFLHTSTPHDGCGLTEVFCNIEEPGSWIALYNIQLDPTYRRFVWEVMSYARPIVSPHENVHDVRGFVFISAPPSVTPFHIDRENNFWLQIHGRKNLFLWDHRDRKTVALDDVQRFIWNGDLENVRLSDDSLGRSTDFPCGPGDGVYFPSTTPHMTRSDRSWIRPGNGVTVSIGIVFYTDRTRRHAWIHASNIFLARLGLKPRAPGESSLADALKVPFGRALVTLMQRFRGYEPTPSYF